MQYYLMIFGFDVPTVEKNQEKSIGSTLIGKIILFIPIIIIIHISDVSGQEKVRIINDHYFRYKNKTLVLIGDSGTQSVMQNINVNYKKWLDDLSARQINAAMIWAWMAVPQRTNTNVLDRRYGYVVADILPWPRSGTGKANDGKSHWDLNSFDDRYWKRLDSFVKYAESKGIVVVLTVFDGWARTKSFWVHPFNEQNGGPVRGAPARGDHPSFVRKISQLIGLSSVKQDTFDAKTRFYTFSNYGTELIDKTYDDNWPWEMKNQYIQEKYAEKLIDTTCARSNVIYELVNEGSSISEYDEHWIRFFKKRCDSIIVINDDFTPLDGRNHTVVDAISWHSLGFDPYELNLRWSSGFHMKPSKPIINSETVPAFSPGHGPENPDAEDPEVYRRAMWSVLLAGAHVLIQDDTVFSYDPNAPPKPKGETMRDYIGYANKFFNKSGLALRNLKPDNELIQSGSAFVLASPGHNYVAYLLGGGEISLNLTGFQHSFEVRWYDPSNGAFSIMNDIRGGNVRSFVSPFTGDVVLWLKKK